jgi:hypothetical protein
MSSFSCFLNTSTERCGCRWLQRDAKGVLIIAPCNRQSGARPLHLRATRSIDYLPSQESDSDLSSLVDEPSKKRARGKSKVNLLFPLCHAPISPYIKIQKSEDGKPRAKSKRTSNALSKDDETIKRLKVPILDFVGPVHASYSPNFPSPSSLRVA